MGIDLSQARWGCWRRSDHRGGKPERLVAALAGCSLDQAFVITGNQRFVPEDFDSRVRELLKPSPRLVDRKGLQLPAEFKKFADIPSCQPFIRYLMDEKRGGFKRSDILRFTNDYGVYYARHGPYRYRVIFTIWTDDKLSCWTGRTIAAEGLRYRTLSVDPDKAANDGHLPALAPTTDLLLWYDDLKKSKADTVVICEGPFDALKVRLLGEANGTTATCLFTMNSSPRQVALLCEVLPRFKKRLLLLDQGTLVNALSVQDKMAGLGVAIAKLPPGIKDPALLHDLAFLAA